MSDLRLARREVRVRAPGTVELSLRVGPRNDDGRHQLSRVFQAVGVYREVTATAAEILQITSPTAGRLSEAEDHLALRAARLLAERTGVSDGAHLHLAGAAGLAGSSSDAAAVLLACDALWDTGLPREELAEIATPLGPEVSFLLLGLTAVSTGRGDALTPALSRGEYHWAFGIRVDGPSRSAVFTEFDRSIPCPKTPELDCDVALLQALRAGDAISLGGLLHNDLQDAAVELCPELLETLSIAQDAGALGVVLSGTGPIVAALARSRQHALALAAAMTAAGVVDAVTTASGPVHGARVLPGSDAF